MSIPRIGSYETIPVEDRPLRIQDLGAPIPIATQLAEPLQRTSTDLSRREARERARADTGIAYRVDGLFRRKAPHRRMGADQNPLGARARSNAQRALTEEQNVPASHPYVAHQRQITTRLDRLGLPRTGADRIHVDEGPDPNLEHGRAVVRTAAGRHGLARGAQTTLMSGPMSEAVARRELSPEQADRYVEATRAMEQPQQNQTFDELVRQHAREQEVDLLDKQMRISEVRRSVEQQGAGGRTFLNMSWGASPAESASAMAQEMMAAPRGSHLHDEARRVLGRAPTAEPGPSSTEAQYQRYQRDMEKLQRELVLPRFRRELGSPEHQERMAAARSGLEQELSRSRNAGILVFEAPTNSFIEATRLGDPALSRSASDGTRGLISVGSVDLNRPGPHDDRVSPFSGDGRITVGAPGSRIPVGAERGNVDLDGTSFASPYATSIAYRMAAANPNLSVDQIAGLIADPRAARDIPGTTRDGAGHLDPFRAILLARNPQLTSEQLDRAWTVSGRGNAEEMRRLRADLGLG